jgi:hypothetical protein
MEEGGVGKVRWRERRPAETADRVAVQPPPKGTENWEVRRQIENIVARIAAFSHITYRRQMVF